MYQGASNHEELHNLIKATVMIRRLKKEVLTELPVKRRQQVLNLTMSILGAWYSYLYTLKICNPDLYMPSLLYLKSEILSVGYFRHTMNSFVIYCDYELEEWLS